MKTGNRSKSTSSASVRSDKALAREEALSESKDIEYHFEELSLEYSEVNNNIRHYSALRFAIFTVYFAVIGGIVSIAFGFFRSYDRDTLRDQSTLILFWLAMIIWILWVIARA